MKKVTAAVFVLIFIIMGLTACDDVPDLIDPDMLDDETLSADLDVIATGPLVIHETLNEDYINTNGILIVYFSMIGEQKAVGDIGEGNTEIIANMIKENTGGALYEIVPKDHRYNTSLEELLETAKNEKESGARPQYKNTVPVLDRFDVIFIGAPVWYEDWPMIMYTFFESEDLSGKILVPFTTYEETGLSGLDQKLKTAVPGSTVLEGLAVKGTDAQNSRDESKEKVDQWLSRINVEQYIQ